MTQDASDYYKRAASLLEKLRDEIGSGFGEGDIEHIGDIVIARLRAWDKLDREDVKRRLSSPPAPSVAVKAEDLARQLWGYFEGDSTGGTTAMQWFDNNKSLGGPAHVIALCRSALSAQVQDVAGWQPIETAPKDKTRIIIAVPTKDRDDWIVGEGYFDPDHYEDGDWWWANLDYSDYHAGPISDCNHWPPELWQPLPVPAAAPAKQER